MTQALPRAPETDGELDEELAATFPASDPSSSSSPGSTRDLPEPRPYATLYRIVPEPAAATAFGPGGVTTRSSRWTTADTPAIYASLSPACALLEFLAHLEDRPQHDLRLVVAYLPLETIDSVAVTALPERWHERPYRADVQRIGDRWAAEGRYLALKVPSALAPREYNVLINTRHPDLEKIALLSNDPVSVDTRLY